MTCNDEGTYSLSLTATDSFGLSSTASSSLTVSNVAPSVGSVTVPVLPQAINTSITASAPFSDAGTLDGHTASWAWGDGTTSAGTVSESNGSGTVSGSHVYSVDGVYTVTLTVTDADGLAGTASSQSYVVIYNPAAGFVTGGGWVTSPTGAYVANASATGKATFGFVSKYLKGATVPSGNTEFHFQAGSLNFNSTAYQWLVISGTCKAQFKGTGTINGGGSYTFILTAYDGERCASPGSDTFRLQITDNNNNGALVYDNGTDEAIGGGDVQIHSN